MKNTNENAGFQATNEGFAPEQNDGIHEVIVYNRGDIAGTELLAQIKNPNSNYYCSVVDDGTRKSKAQIFNAVSGSAEQLVDHKDKVLEIVDVAAHPVFLPDKNTGELRECLRTVLIDKNGVVYQAVSSVLVQKLALAYGIVGAPSWKDEPLKIIVREEKTSNKNTMTTFELVIE